jgi:hypothetical protein
VPRKHRPFRPGKLPKVGPFTEVKPLPPDAGPVDQVWDDGTHTVLVIRFTFAGDPWIHLVIRRRDGAKLSDHWTTLQRIKDLLLGTEVEAVDPHPRRSNLPDEDNVFHLYCNAGARFPFGPTSAEKTS